MAMTYAQFVKAHYHDASHKGMKPQDVMKSLGKMWRASGHSKTKGGAVSAGAVSAGAVHRKPHSGRSKRQVKGGGDIGHAIGSVLGSILPF